MISKLLLITSCYINIRQTSFSVFILFRDLRKREDALHLASYLIRYNFFSNISATSDTLGRHSQILIMSKIYLISIFLFPTKTNLLN